MTYSYGGRDVCQRVRIRLLDRRHDGAIETTVTETPDRRATLTWVMESRRLKITLERVRADNAWRDSRARHQGRNSSPACGRRRNRSGGPCPRESDRRLGNPRHPRRTMAALWPTGRKGRSLQTALPPTAQQARSANTVPAVEAEGVVMVRDGDRDEPGRSRGIRIRGIDLLKHIPWRRGQPTSRWF